MPIVDSKFSNFRSGGQLVVGDVVVGLRGGLNTQFTVTDTLPPGTIVPIENGGTDANNAAQARINLGLAIGTNVEAWSASLDALAALSGTGLVTQTGVNSFTDRSITGTSNQINVTNGNGVSGNPTLALSSALVLPGTLALGGTFNTAGYAITNSVTDGDVDITTTGAGLFVINGTQGVNGISNDATLSADSSELIPTQAAVKAYADSISAGLTWITPPAVCATTGDLAGYIYANGAAGVGATLTAGSNGAFSADGVSPALNAVVLVRAQTATEENGIYTLTTVGDGSNPAVLTRATNYDEVSEIVPGSAIAVTGGTTYGGSIFVETATVATIGTDPIIFIQSSVPASAFVTIATNQTITGQKTFSSAKLLLAGSGSGSTVLNASATASGTLTLPAATDTLVARATTDTLTNKTISGSANTLSNIAVSSLANGTDGELITWDSSGVATTIAVGTSGYVLTSNGAGQEATWEAPTVPADFTCSSITFSPTTEGIVGTTAADNCDPGFVGEYIEDVNSAGTVITAGVPTTVSSITLTAGDWDVQASIQCFGTNINNAYLCGVSTTDNTFESPFFQYGGQTVITNTSQINILGGNTTCTSPMVRINVSTTTTVYCVAQINNGGGSPTVYGMTRARRMR